MNKHIKYVLIAAVAVTIVTLGVFSPFLLSMIQDRDIIGQVQAHGVQRNTYSDTEIYEMSMIQKLSLLDSDSEEINPIVVETGNRFNHDSVIAQCTGEIEILEDAGLFPPMDDQRVKVISTFLLIRLDAPSQNAIIWGLTVEYPNGGANIYIDDETGKIVRAMVKHEGDFYREKDDLTVAEAWGTYLGVEVAGIDIREHATTSVRVYDPIYNTNVETDMGLPTPIGRNVNVEFIKNEKKAIYSLYIQSDMMGFGMTRYF